MSTYRANDYRKDSWFSRMAAARRRRVLCQRKRIAQQEGNQAIVRYCEMEMAK